MASQKQQTKQPASTQPHNRMAILSGKKATFEPMNKKKKQNPYVT